MQLVRVLLVLLLSFQIMSCATIINGSSEKIDIYSSVAETRIFINDVYIGQAGPETPLEATIPKRGRVEITGKRDGCEDAEAVVRRSIDPATFLGLLIDGGIISILFVDILGTNAFVHANQNTYTLEPNCHS